ncbi:MULTISPECIES: DUF1203 domain-containing protein [Streptomyces]|uniref:DUF1203 domain-containing protein n=1 Tax=Streptomyces chartreusis NRRL 3882 TaxID=1079985 RepID=A0A2N9BEK2_STRCX|nr:MULTISPECIES: DUF1203 domain-containing protein [Streptomyces]MYS92513.1 DUF1203 domain-containing protein [Streptomyces sp. SID5464]SOR81799.1 hypothetical protein SCNRRL3882_5251 [Streptomyces chartreusis NRRL 3882]
MTTTYTARPIAPRVLKELRTTDDAGRPTAPFTDTEGGAPLRCCLGRSEPGDRIALVSYAPLRRWAAEKGADPGAYDEVGPVFVHADDCPGPDTGAALPFTNAHRTVRRYSAEGHILGGRLVEEPETFEQAFAEAFDDPAVALVHVRAVEYGCFLYEVRRD